jgi:hypothetical protein
VNWLSLALAVASLLQWIAGRLDKAEQEKLSGAVMALAFIKEADNAIAKAKAARAAAERDASTDGLRSTDKPDPFRRD